MSDDGMRGCTDDDHAFGCPCGVGGDAVPAACWVCGQRTDGFTAMWVSTEDGLRLVDADCWSRDEPRLPVSYEVA